MLGFNKTFAITLMIAIAISILTKNIWYLFIIISIYAVIRIIYNFFTIRP